MEAVRAVDHDGQHGHLTAQGEEAVAVGWVVAVVAPDPAQRGGAGGSGFPEAADELEVQGVAVVLGLLAGADHELVPDAQTLQVVGRQGYGSASRRPSRLQTRMPATGRLTLGAGACFAYAASDRNQGGSV